MPIRQTAMASITGIELGPDSCVLVAVRPAQAGAAEVRALHLIGPSEWPAHDVAIRDALRSARRRRRFPRRATVVAWGLPDDATDEVTARAALAPLEAAGFRIESILSPPQALARVAAARPRQAPSDAVAWLALNTHGAAIAIVRGGELLFARTFQWTYNPALTATRAQLLQRYSLIAHLAPEVRHGVAHVRASHGANVDAVVTCGNFPELRSLTMPLIEELDVEVETLDSADGLVAAGSVTPERLVEAAPAVRLASAAALTPALVAAPAPAASSIWRAAAAAALVGALAWGGYTYWNVFAARPAKPVPVAPRVASTRPAPRVLPVPTGTPRQTPELKPAPPTSFLRAPAPPPAAPPPTARIEPKAVPPSPRLNTGLEPAPAAPHAPPAAGPAPGPLTSQRSSQPSPVPVPVPSSTLRGGTEQPLPVPGDMRSVVLPAPARQAPLREPLPRLDSILIDQDRRLAIIDGVVVRLGDPVGPRTVIQIERDAVVLGEPSGLSVRITLRSRSAG